MLWLRQMPGLVRQLVGLVQDLSSLAASIRAGLKSMTDLNTKIAALQADVSAIKTSEASALALIQGLSGQLSDALAAAKANGMTEEQGAALDALDATLKDQAASLAAAVTANTPAPPSEPEAAAGEQQSEEPQAAA